MILLLNTSEPIMIIIYTLLIAAIIFISKETKNPAMLFIVIFAIIFMLINHSVMLEDLKHSKEGGISEIYHCIGMDLIFLLLTFISYLWVDDMSAKKNKKKSYDDSLSWFWDKL